MKILLHPVLVIEHVPAMTIKLFAGDVREEPPPTALPPLVRFSKFTVPAIESTLLPFTMDMMSVFAESGEKSSIFCVQTPFFTINFLSLATVPYPPGYFFKGLADYLLMYT